jgi:hypothetical protein
LVQQSFASRQGGFYEFKPMYISQLPIPSAGPEDTRCVEVFARALIRLGGEGPHCAYFERLLNALVYQLFFPELFAEQGLNLFTLLQKAPPPSNAAPEEWDAFHKVISDVNHPVYAALFALNSLDVVRIIEGRA